MRFSKIAYLFGEGFRNVFKNKKASVASLVTMLCAMFIFGIAFVIGENANSIVKQVSSAQGIQVYIQNVATDEQVKEIESKIWNIGNDKIATVKFVSKQQALETMKKALGNDADLLDGYEGENNIFPVSYKITLTELEYSKEVEEIIKSWDLIDEVRSSNQTIEALINIANGVRVATIVIFALLLVMAVTIISNTIKLSVHSRRKEISIMKYVGATNGFIKGPFIVEGMVIGVFSAGMTLVILSGLYDLVIQKIGTSTVLKSMGITLMNFQEMASSIGLVYLLLGIGIGIIGSSISMNKYLDV